ncbi:MAG: hypothetical protein IT422_21840 [Pirellulaceae bacterium]|jgi:hypothetical protein|nr:hypothetical protein [Pirellulaceae bacterium]
MSSSESGHPKLTRAIVVEMSSEAIAQRIRETAKLHELDLSLSRAKRIHIPDRLPMIRLAKICLLSLIGNLRMANSLSSTVSWFCTERTVLSLAVIIHVEALAHTAARF